MTNLSSLICFWSQIRTYSRCSHALNALSIYNRRGLASNRMTSVPASLLGTLSQLETLYVSFIQTCILTYLTQCCSDLSNNQLQQIPDDFLAHNSNLNLMFACFVASWTMLEPTYTLLSEALLATRSRRLDMPRLAGCHC